MADAVRWKIYRSYLGDTEPGVAPRYFLSRSIVNGLTPDERQTEVADAVWQRILDVTKEQGWLADLDHYLTEVWRIQGGMDAFIHSRPTLAVAVVHLADFGIDQEYLKLLTRSRKARIGTDMIDPLIVSGELTRENLIAVLRAANSTRLGGVFSEVEIGDLDRALRPLCDAEGHLIPGHRELISVYMRIFLNGRLLGRLRQQTDHQARPLLNILLEGTCMAQRLRRDGPDTRVISVDEACISGTSVIAIDLVLKSFAPMLIHKSLNVAQRTEDAAWYLLDNGGVDIVVAHGIWMQEDMLHLYDGYYQGRPDGVPEYRLFEDLVCQLRTRHKTINTATEKDCRYDLMHFNSRINRLAADERFSPYFSDLRKIPPGRFAFGEVCLHLVKLYLRQDDPEAFYWERMLMDNDLLQVISPFEADFTGWFQLRDQRDLAIVWLGQLENELPDLFADLRTMDHSVRYYDLALNYARIISQYRRNQRRLYEGVTTLMSGPLYPAMRQYVDSKVSFEQLTRMFYQHAPSGPDGERIRRVTYEANGTIRQELRSD